MQIKNFFVLQNDVVTIHGSKNLTSLIDFKDWLDVCDKRWYIRTYTKRPGLAYMLTTIKDKKVYLHNALLRAKMVDHINQNPLDNRRVNLRVTSYNQNTANGRKRKDNNSGYRGVFWDTSRSRWVAKMSVDYHDIHLGCFMDPQTASEAYKTTCLEWYGVYNG
jgi:hypothetical protein